MDVFVTGGTGTDRCSRGQRTCFQKEARVIALGTLGGLPPTSCVLSAQAPSPEICKHSESWVGRAASCDAVIHAGATFAPMTWDRIDRLSMLALKQAAKHRKLPLKARSTLVVSGCFPKPLVALKPSRRRHRLHLSPPFRFMAETIRTLSHGTDLNLVVIHPALWSAA